MFNSAVLDVAVGLVFVFLTVSLICGLLTEAVATMLSWRANTLLAGVQALVNDPGFTKLAQGLYQHALVNPRDPGTATATTALVNKPSYIDPSQFAGAMLDTLNVGAGTAATMKAAIGNSPLIANDVQMKTMLTGMADRAGGDIDTLRDSIAAWFAAGMDRVSGSYKRRTQVFCFLFGLTLAIVLNIDSLQVAAALWQQPQVTHALAATPDLNRALAQIQALKLPIGWAADGTQCPRTAFGWLGKLLGWSITALSTLFGATFWFDALSNVLKMRGSGPIPIGKP